MSVLALLINLPLGDFFDKLPRDKQQVPQAYTETTRLPGKTPASSKDLAGAWEMNYSEEDVQVEDLSVDLTVKMVVQINEDGSYLLRYSGNWGKAKEARGVTIDERGTYKLSSDVLILDPAKVTRTDQERSKSAEPVELADDKHVFVVHAETKRIHLAGRCAAWQLDPICEDGNAENVWFTFKGPAKKLER